MEPRACGSGMIPPDRTRPRVRILEGCQRFAHFETAILASLQDALEFGERTGGVVLRQAQDSTPGYRSMNPSGSRRPVSVDQDWG